MKLEKNIIGEKYSLRRNTKGEEVKNRERGRKQNQKEEKLNIKIELMKRRGKKENGIKREKGK